MASSAFEEIFSTLGEAMAVDEEEEEAAGAAGDVDPGGSCLRGILRGGGEEGTARRSGREEPVE